jgi:hypothetical protein
MTRFKIFAVVAIVALALTVPVLALAAPAGQAGTPTVVSPLTITLNQQNNSGESGTAVLTDLGNGQTKVDVTITGEPEGLSQPEHIHKGTCDNLDVNPAYALQPLVNGKSTTVVQVSLSDLLVTPYAINGHKSAQEISTYVFCGSITTAAATATSTTAATLAPTEAATTAPTLAATTAPTEAPTVAATVAPTVAATEAPTTAPAAAATPTTVESTPAATSTAVPSSIPTTGGAGSSNILIAALALGTLALIAGILLRRSSVR